MSFAAYHAYRQQQEDWFNEVPTHWHVRRVIDVARVLYGYPFDSAFFSSTEGFPLVRIRDLGRSVTELNYAGNFVDSAGISSDDVLIGMDGDFNVGRWRGSGPALLNQRMCCIRGTSSEMTRYLEYSLPFPLRAINEITYSTTVKHLSSSQVEKIRIPLPPDNERARILAFLDRETAKIDALVSEQERLIELLKEKRQTVISHAVTKGLDPGAPTKDSGIQWIGEIPSHWSLERGRFLYEKLELPAEADDGVVTAFRDGQVTLRENRRTDGFTVAVLEVGYQHVREGDLVIHGMDAFAGAIGVSESTGKCTPEYAVLSPRRADLVNKYFALALRLMALRGYVLVICPSVRERAPRFRFEAFKDVLLPVPPLHEQRKILEYISSEEGRLSALLCQAEQLIDVLQERRAALISAAVTGQIDVRGAAERSAA